MIDRKMLRSAEAMDQLAGQLAKRGFELDQALLTELDLARRTTLQRMENARADKKKVSADIGAAIRAGKTPEEAKEAAAVALGDLDAVIADATEESRQIDEKLEAMLLQIPNPPQPDVPEGKDEMGNVELRTWGNIPEFGKEFPQGPLAHWDLAENLGLIDFAAAARLSGARFAVYKGMGARLERGLANFMLDRHYKAGYTEIIPPYMVNSATMQGTGQLPKFADDLFQLKDRDLWLIPTAEVPVTNLVADSIRSESELPLRYCALTPCFRAEAGAAGRDTRGIIRQHQFHKVELVHICTPDKGHEELATLTAQAESILQELELPYRVIELCTGDLGFSASRTYDLEVWSPGQNRYVEISSCSLMTDFQARRMKARFKDADGKNQLLHTLNGSALAVGRTWMAILENFQQANGSIRIPEALKEFVGCDTIKVS